MSNTQPLNQPAGQSQSNPSADRTRRSREPIGNALRAASRWGLNTIHRIQVLAKAAQSYVNRKGGWRQAPFVALKRCWGLLKANGVSGLSRQVRLYLYQVARNHSYRIPLSAQLSKAQAEVIHQAVERQPLISIVIPVYKVDPRWLNLCIRSVVNQHYENWEAILVDDCSHQPALTSLMTHWSRRDSRIRCVQLETNHNISEATNAGIQIARGEFIGFLDHDDELTPDALTWVVASCNEHPEAKWFYSDEAVLSPEGKCINLHMKPDYSPEYLLSIMYTCHFSVYSAEVIRDVGGMRQGFEGAQDHDLALRIAEKVPRHQVVHIPRVLYIWRAIETSTAADVGLKPQAGIAGQRAVTEALARRGIPGTVTPSVHCSSMYEIALSPQSRPPVSIIIPTKNGLADLQKCVSSLHQKTRYPRYEVVVIDNQSDDPQLRAYLKTEQAAGRLRTMDYDKPFNHSRMNNLAVRACESDYVVFMNNDVELISEGWLETLVGTVQMEDSIAGVGAKLLYPDDTIQHGGILLGICGLAGHAHRFVADSDPGYLGRAGLLNEFSGATAALLLMRKSAFEDVGGFDEETFPTSFNDVDLWIRLQKAGYRCLYNPLVKAYHYESKSRKTPRASEAEYENRLKTRWRAELEHDRFYNPNLEADNEIFLHHRPFPFEIRYVKQGKMFSIRFNNHDGRAEIVAVEPPRETPPLPNRKALKPAA